MWADSRVLVTGGASFIGSHLTEALLRKGAIVTIADNFSSGTMQNLKDIEGFHEYTEKSRAIVANGDLASEEFTHDVTRKQNVVFHLAASHGGRGYIDSHPADCCRNMLLDQMVFDVAVGNNVERICYASSACVYPRHLQHGEVDYNLKEDDVSLDFPGKAHADREYGWAKLMGEMSMSSYHKQYGVKTSSARIFTAYGPRENESHAVMALIAKAFVRQDPYEIWGDGEQDRNFTYVDDIVLGMILLAERIEDGRAVNIGIDEHLRIVDLVDLILRAIGWHPNQFHFNSERPVGVRSRAADLTVARNLLGWQPRVGFEEGVRRTVEWYIRTKDPDTIRSRLGQLLVERNSPASVEVEA